MIIIFENKVVITIIVVRTKNTINIAIIAIIEESSITTINTGSAITIYVPRAREIQTDLIKSINSFASKIIFSEIQYFK